MIPLIALPLLFQTAQTFTIGGTLVNSVTGAAIAKARVSLSPTTPPAAAASVTTGADGRFRFEGLKPGKYRLEADRLGYVTQRFGQRALYERYSSAIAVGENEMTDNLVFRMAPSSVISGYVTDLQGEPVPGMTVAALQIVGNGKGRRVLRSPGGATDDRGYYRLPSLAAGIFAVVVAGRPFQSGQIATVEPMAYPLTFHPGTTNPDEANLVTLKPGQEVRADVVLRAVPTGRISGEAPGVDPNKQVFAVLTAPALLNRRLAAVPSVWLGAGHFFFDDVPVGNYRIELEAESQEVAGAADISVQPGETKVTVGHASFAQVTFSVTIEGKPKNPRSTLTAGLQSVEGANLTQPVGANGKAVIPQTRAGRYQVMITQGRALAIKSMTVRGAAAVGDAVDIPETGSVEIDVTIDAAAVDLSGRLVRDGRGQPGVLVMLAQRDAWQYTASYRFDQTDSDGTFTWPNVPRGEYLMFALEDGLPYDYDDPDTIRKLLPIAQPLTVSGDPAQTVEIKLLPMPAEK